MSDGLLIVVVLAALAVLLVVQVVSARAARRLGGSSATPAIALRIVNLVAVIGLMVWLIYDRLAG